jgi:5-(carboxyamino)imidazole ribonucleotide synthase
MSRNISPILPGATLGMLGGGQLGRMFSLAASRLGYKVIVFAPESDSPAGEVSYQHICAPYEDEERLLKFARDVAVISLEFENIPVATLERVSELAPVRPGPKVLAVSQHRIKEKSTLQAAGFLVTPFLPVEPDTDLTKVAQELGLPLVLKTVQFGYDGKGQQIVRSLDQLQSARQNLGDGLLIAEKMIDFRAEVSILVARNPQGETVVYPLVENEHRNHILDVTRCPVSSELLALDHAAQQIALGVADTLQLEGLLCIEFFVAGDQLMINEIAPRPHNSGHWTIEGCVTSQFEQQVRAICNLPLGSTELVGPCAMVNILGDLWGTGSPDWKLAMQQARTYLHLYGKSKAVAGRKMGHITQLADSSRQASANLRNLREAMKG